MTSFTTIAGTTGRITGTAARLTLQAGRHARRLTDQIDWREVATIVVLGLVTAIALTWEAGFRLGRFVHQLNDALAREWVAALGVLERPAAETVACPAEVAAKPVRRPHPQPAPQPVPALTPAPVVATWAVPLDRAVSAVRCGQASQRQAARRYGISRTSLQRALAAA